MRDFVDEDYESAIIAVEMSQVMDCFIFHIMNIHVMSLFNEYHTPSEKYPSL